MTGHVRRTALAAIIAVALACTANTAGAQSDPQLEQARAMLKEGKAAQAFELLEPREFDRAGDVEFDTLLGVAALDSGKPDRATLAFERVLAVDPNAAGARLDMARAYFALGDYARAKMEFNIVAQNDPPPGARAVIDKYLAAIAERERGRRTAISKYVEAFAGYDDNITSVVGDFTSAVLSTYNLPGFQPTGNAIMRGSSILGIGAGIDVNHRLDDNWSLSAGGDLRHRGVLRANNYSSDQLDLKAGVAHERGANMVRGGITLQEYQQRTDVPTANRSAIGLNVEWRHSYSPADQSSLFAAATRQRFPDIAVNDVNSFVVGAGWVHAFEGARMPVLMASVAIGQDDAREKLANGADNSRDLAMARVVAQVAATDNAELFAAAGMVYRSDRSAYARSLNAAYGHDHMADLTFGWNWRFAPGWTVRPQVTHSENRSNVALSEYRRTEFSVTLRYDFR